MGRGSWVEESKLAAEDQPSRGKAAVSNPDEAPQERGTVHPQNSPGRFLPSSSLPTPHLATPRTCPLQGRTATRDPGSHPAGARQGHTPLRRAALSVKVTGVGVPVREGAAGVQTSNTPPVLRASSARLRAQGSEAPPGGGGARPRAGLPGHGLRDGPGAHGHLDPLLPLLSPGVRQHVVLVGAQLVGVVQLHGGDQVCPKHLGRRERHRHLIRAF